MKSTATNYKISWLAREDRAGTLDLSPPFQRKPIWSDEQASYLIDSILLGLPFPEIYLRSTSSPQGDTRHEVVDGQQRTRSILRFTKDDLELVGDDVSPKWLGKRFDDLTDGEKRQFWDYEVVVRDLGGASDQEIRDLFRRLNVNAEPLTDQELRHAHFSGSFIKLMENLADDPWWLDKKVVTVREIRRMRDVEFISELFIGLVAGPQDKKKTLDDYYENFERSMPDEAKWTARFNATKGLVDSVMGSEVPAWSGASDFYTLFLLFGALSEKTQLLSDRKKKAIRQALTTFRQRVDTAKRKDNKKQFQANIMDYVEAVTRAASDVGRREARLRILEALIR
jgi:uncharacterized protein DUF262